MGLYHKIEDSVISAIHCALGGQWWNNLSDDAQERIHDELFHVLESAQPQDKGSAGQQSASPCNNARGEICAHYVQFEDCVFFPGDVSCGEKGCAVKPRRLSPIA